MEPPGPVSRVTCLKREPGQMVNFIHEKISEYIESSQPAFTILDQPIKRVDPPPYNRNLSRPAHWAR